MQIQTTNPVALVEYLATQGTAPTASVLDAYGYSRKVRLPGVSVTVFNAKATGDYVLSAGDSLYFFNSLGENNWLVCMITVANRTNPVTLQVVFDEELWQPRENGVSLVCTADLVYAENIHTVVINTLQGSIEQGTLITYPGYRTTNRTTSQVKEVIQELTKHGYTGFLTDIYKVLNNS